MRAIALAPAGLVVQLPGGVEIRKGSRTTPVAMPTGAAMTDYAEGRILYTARNGDVHARKVAGGHDTLLLKGGSGARAVDGDTRHARARVGARQGAHLRLRRLRGYGS